MGSQEEEGKAKMKSIEWQKLKTQTESCEGCPSLVCSRKLYSFGKPSFGYGSLNSPLVVIGQCPGYKGCGQTGIPFTQDKSGQLYQEALKACRLTAEQVYTTNIVKCCPENNRNPTRAEIFRCLTILKEELNIVSPKIIFSLGKVASEGIGQTASNMALMNVKLYHPAYYLYIGKPKQFIQDFKYEYEKYKTLLDFNIEKQANLADFWKESLKDIAFTEKECQDKLTKEG